MKITGIKAASILLLLFLSFQAAACGKDSEKSSIAGAGRTSAEAETGSSPKEKGEGADDDPGTGDREFSDTEDPNAEQTGRILIAYFTWADNTHVDDPSSVDTDATTSASVLVPGNTAKLAAWIQEEVGGDLFSITTVQPYSSDYDECLERAVKEHDSGVFPELNDRVENIEDYDIVFLGFPNWWYSCPMAVLAFIQENDLSGKTVIPFCSHGTGGFAASLNDIGKELPEDCTVL